MSFSPNGKWLLTISANELHTIRLWDWRLAAHPSPDKRRFALLAEVQGFKGIAPQVLPPSRSAHALHRSGKRVLMHAYAC